MRPELSDGSEPLESLADAREHLIEASARLRARPEVKRVRSGVDCRGYQSGSAFEVYVEAEFETGFTLTWWLEITWNRHWKIAARVLREDDGGQKTVHQFADRFAADANEFGLGFAQVVDEVVESIGHPVELVK